MSILTIRSACRLLALSIVIFSLVSATAQAADITGTWRGKWTSDAKGHSGPMRATICKIDEHHYRATFSGRFFMSLIPFRYSIVLTAQPDGDGVLLSGQQQLGRLAGGTYQYSGRATDCCFHVNYTSCKHYGSFQMTKCGCR